jgi:diguanylate cyclase (GGDEF)-like protein
MEPLIKHLVGITGHRDHSLLDVSVVSALYDLVGAVQVRALEIFRFRDELYVRPRVWVQDGRVVSSEETLGTDHGGELISEFPSLMACLSEHINSAEETTLDGDFVLWLPVWLNDKVTCCLHIVNSTPYSAHTRDVIEGILGVYRNYQSLLDYSERDSLTGLLNRKTFDEKFSKMVAGGFVDDESGEKFETERRQPVDIPEQWLAVVDIDHFKRVNDQFGHLYGDEVLILVANILRQSFRLQDKVFRFGGEEFVILLRSTTHDDALRIFERFRTSVEKHHFPQVGQVTVSVGFVKITPSETPVVILGHADQALYYAKANGRNRVCNYEELVAGGSLQTEIKQAPMEFFFDNPIEPEQK